VLLWFWECGVEVRVRVRIKGEMVDDLGEMKKKGRLCGLEEVEL
jgi:hypothetical protein